MYTVPYRRRTSSQPLANVWHVPVAQGGNKIDGENRTEEDSSPGTCAVPRDHREERHTVVGEWTKLADDHSVKIRTRRVLQQRCRLRGFLREQQERTKWRRYNTITLYCNKTSNTILLNV